MDDKDNLGKKHLMPNIVLNNYDEASGSSVHELDPTTGQPRVRSRTSSVRSGAKLAMPSKQAKKLTTAFNKLVKLRRAGSVRAVIHDTLREVETELSTLRMELEKVTPADDLQRKFKESWIAGAIGRKERFLEEVRQALLTMCEDEDDVDRIDLASMTSSMRRDAILAEEEEAKLLLEQQQLRQRQERRRKEQEEQDALALRLAGVRARKKAMCKFGSVASSTSSLGKKTLSQLPPPLPQPTERWLEQSHQAPQAPPEPAPLRQQGYDQDTQSALMQQILLAQAQLPVFKGDPLDYMWFKQSFEVQVEAVTPDPRRRLYLLLQQLEGEPKTLVRACQLLQDPSEGFHRAKTLLDDRYGNPIRQALAFMSKLTEWPPIRGTQDLTSFSVQLQQCQELQRGSLGFQELDSAPNLLKLAAKLPSKMQESWQVTVVDIEMQKGRPAAFGDFVAFVRRVEAARNHPVYGKLEPSKHARQELKTLATAVVPQQVQTQASVVAGSSQYEEETSATAPSKDERPDAFRAPCLLCTGSHATSKCSTAHLLSREARREKLRGLCFACLKPGHSARACKSRLRCDQCQGMHPTVLHEDRTADTSKKQVAATEIQAETSQVEQEALPGPHEENAATSCGSAHAMGTALTWVSTSESGAGAVRARALLDSASSATFVTRSLAQRLQAKVLPVSLQVATLLGGSEVSAGLVVGLRLAGIEEDEVLDVDMAYVVEKLPTGGARFKADYATHWPHLRGLPIDASQTELPVEVLIGQNVPMALFPLEAVRAGPSEPYAVRTAIGWTLQGPLAQATGHSAVTNLTMLEDVSMKLDRLHYYDFAEACNFSKKGLSVEDRRWLQDVERSTQRGADGHYTVGLPFRLGGQGKLKNNHSQALQWMESLRRKFAASAQFKADYSAFIQKMIDSQHVELADENASGTANYVTHHGVYHPRKPDKIRVVFNCAGKFRGVALNDCLVPGPDLTNSIVGVLIRFRQQRVAVMADIEAMFYQVLVPESERDFLRFLWWSNGKTDQRLITYRMRVHLFGDSSSPSVANFALRRAAQEAYDNGVVGEATLTTVQRNFYVDDCLKSFASEQEAVRAARELVVACRYGGFKLAKFVSNSVAVLQSLDKRMLAKDLECVDFSNDKADPLGTLQERALGVAWDVSQDCFYFRIAVPVSKDAPTRRSILSKLSSVYDPLGMAAPVIIEARILFRELSKSNSQWDAPISEEEGRVWKSWVKGLGNLQSVRIRRCYASVPDPEGVWELHTFCDASSNAYAAVCYLLHTTDKHSKVSFVMGKVRVAPPKVVTIPRLELTAAKLGAELADLVQSELEVPIASRTFWSDSETVLKYLNNSSKRFPVFVANRVHSILSASEKEEWRYVPTKLNPADEGSRGLKADQMNDCKWLRGPQFLCQEKATWPAPIGPLEMQECEVAATAATAIREEEHQTWINELAAQCSSATRFRRIIAVWLRLKDHLRHKSCIRKGPITLAELRRAEKEAIKIIQGETWADEIRTVNNGEYVKRSSPLFKLSPTVTDGVLCMQSRTRTQVPIVPAGAISQLFVREAHESTAHLGRQATAAMANKRRWIMGLNKTARKVVRTCARCQRNYAMPSTTFMADLPPFRMSPGHPFQTAGVDYFGPFTVRRQQTRYKAYGVIFTCAVSRAVHLEVAESLSGNSFIYALYRFVARRGHVQKIVSDNGTNLESAQDKLDKALMKEIELLKSSENEVRIKLMAKGIEWLFNPPGAPHHGGFFERLIGIVKRCLKGLLSQRVTLTFEALATLLCECEAVMNARPLTPWSDDPNDFEPLTPNHLLIGRENGQLCVGNYEDTARAVRQQWKQVRHFTKQFWKRWQNEYVLLLRRRTKWFTSNQRPLRPGDAVLVVEPISPREDWMLGRVEAVHMGPDGHIRSADIKTRTGSLTRPIVKLCLLETASE